MTKPPKDFAVFILTHGRPDKVITLRTLEKCGYTGPIYLIIDNEDKTADKYYENFGDKVIMFDKKAIAQKVDNGDNFKNYRSTTHVRNAIFDIAKDLGVKYFVQLDDDYTAFQYTVNDNKEYITQRGRIKNISKIFSIFVEFLKESECNSVCFAQGGDFIGGENSNVFKKGIARKAMNSFICRTDKRFWFISRLNEDVNTYLTLGVTGQLFFTISDIRLEQLATQSNDGGMSASYLESGTYVKSFYTVMYCPSFCLIRPMGWKNPRLHHSITWKNAVPQIIREKWKK